MFCATCGRQNPDSSRFCVGCGVALGGALVASPPTLPAHLGQRSPAKVFAQGKSPGLALVMSLIIVGLGQFYNGDVKKGLLMLVGAIIGGVISVSLLWWIMALWSAVDAYRVAKCTVPLWA